MKPHFLIDFNGINHQTRFIQKFCKIFSTVYITQNLNPIPSSVKSSSILDIILSSPFISIKTFFLFVFKNIIPKKPLYPDISYLVGNISLNSFNKNSKHIFTSSQALYEIKNASFIHKNNKSLPKEYILFIDDCISESIDFKLTNKSEIISSTEYYPMLNKFLNVLSKKLKIQVIVAAHPNGKDIKNYTKNFRTDLVYFDSVAYLTRSAKFVLSHYSTALNYPVIFKKPIILMNFKKLKNSASSLILQNFAKLLNCRVINIDEFSLIDFEKFFSKKNIMIDSKAYLNFYKDYISNEKSVNYKGQFYNLINYLNSI